MKSKFLRILSGFLSIAMVICSVVNLSEVAFAENQVVENAITVTASSVTLKRGENYVEITDSTVVDNGDILALEFAWKTDDDKHSPPITFKYDLSSQLKNISISNQKIATTDATYRIEGQTLYIDIESGSSGRSGTCSLSGTIDLSNAVIDSNNKTEIQFIDKSFTPTVYTASPSLYVNKSEVGECTLESDGAYYQSFTVVVSNTSNELDATDAKLTDTFANADNNLFADTSLYNFAITDSSGSTQNYGTKSIGETVALPTIPKGKSVTVSYKVKVDKSKALNRMDGNNVATVKYFDDKKEAVDWGTVKVSVPHVSKSGTYIEAENAIEWTIKVTPNSLVGSDPDFIVIDSSDDLTSAVIKDAIAGSIITADGVSVPKAAFTKNGSEYTLNYKTELTDDYKDQIVDKYVNNKAIATFTVDEKPYKYDGSTSVKVEGKEISLIKKDASNVDYATGVITWETVISVPNEPTLSTFEFYDTLNNWVENQGMSYFDVNTIKDAILVNGLAVTADVGEFDSNFNNGYFKIKFTPAFIAASLGNDVTISYTSTMDISVTGYENLAYKNTGGVTIGFADNTTRTQSVDAIVTKNFKGQKVTRNGLSSVTSGNSNLKNPLGWVIRLKNNAGYTYTAGKTITVTDTLPKGCRIVDGSQRLGVYNYEWDGSGDWNNTVVSYTQTVNNEKDVQTVTFSYTITDDLQGNWLCIAFDTYMTDNYYEEFNLDNDEDTPVAITNNAAINIAGEDNVYVSGTQYVTPSQDSILTKSTISQEQLYEGDKAKNEFTAKYQIAVNQGMHDIVEGEGGTLTLSDTLGTWLDVDMDSVKVEPAIAKDKISYDNQTRTLKFILEDEKAYIITYDVNGFCAPIKNTGSSVGVDQSNVDDMYGNSVKLEGRSSSTFYDNVMLESGTYKAKATYTYNMKLSGTKTWFDSAHAYLVPQTVTIKINQIMITPQNERTTSLIEETIIPKVDDGSETGSWTYSRDNLIAMDMDGNRYEYVLEEVKVGGDGYDESGYVVDYSEAKVGNDKHNIVIDFKNTFTAYKDEVGTISITKAWDDNNSASRPNIKFKVENNGGYSETFVYNGTAITISDLPMYAYSRNTEDKLVKTPYVYTITEIVDADSGYTVSYKLDGNTIAADANGVVNIGSFAAKGSTKAVVVTNKKGESSTTTTTAATTTTAGSGTTTTAGNGTTTTAGSGTTTTVGSGTTTTANVGTTTTAGGVTTTTTSGKSTETDGKLTTTSGDKASESDDKVTTTSGDKASESDDKVTTTSDDKVTTTSGDKASESDDKVTTTSGDKASESGDKVTTTSGDKASESGGKKTTTTTAIDSVIVDENTDKDSDVSYETEESNPVTHVAISLPLIMTIALGGVAAFAGKKRK